MSGLLTVLPIITAQPVADACVASLKRPGSAAGLDLASELLVVDNSRDGFAETRYGLPTYRDPDGHNLGVAGAWNVGARRVLESDADYLVLLSASMLFGPILHTTWHRQLDEFWGAKVIEADGHSWHLIALHRSCFEKIGLFDENFYPYAFEQIDWCYRLRMVGWEHGFVRVWVNALSQGHAMHVDAVACPAQPLLDYYADKWSGAKGQEKWVQPWGRHPLDYWPQRTVSAMAKDYGLGEYGEGWW